jgi:thiol-disulfide isomerase/thioredoxin
MKTGIALLCVALGAAAAGFVAYRRLNAPAVIGTTATAVAPLASAAPRPADSAPPAVAALSSGTAPAAKAASEMPPQRVVPEVVPAVSLADLGGQRHSLREYRGRPTIFNFWATWCAPCRREIPLLNRLYRDYAPRQLQIVGIAVDFRDAVTRYTATTRFDYPLLVGEDDGLEAAQKFGMDMALPFSIFVDSRQRIVAAKLGELHRDDADVIIKAVLAVDAGKLALPDARQQISSRLRELAQARAAK